MVNKLELQIGNQVLYQHKIVTVKSIGSYSCTFFDHESALTYEDLDPIELKPNKLIEIGFKEIKGFDGITYNSLKFLIKKVEDKWSFRKIMQDSSSTIILEFNNLHELQNIYYNIEHRHLIPIPNDNN